MKDEDVRKKGKKEKRGNGKREERKTRKEKKGN